MEECTWYSANGDLAYQTLVLEHFERMSSRVRFDLEDGFKMFKKEADDRFRLILGDKADSIIKSWDEVNDFVRSKYVAAALAGLVEHAEPSDVHIARKYLLSSNLNNDDVALQAIRLIKRFGDASDVGELIIIAKTSYGPTKELAAETALQVAEKFEDACKPFLETEDAILVRIALRSLGKEDTSNINPDFASLLMQKPNSG